jgi:hypothetical protein
MARATRVSPLTGSLDIVGATTSLVCAIHCAIVALLLGALPAASFLAASWVEWAFLSASTLIGVIALVPGYRRHGRRTPMVLFLLGIAILFALRAAQASASAGEMLLVGIAAVCLISAHWQNRGALHKCACGPAHHHG